jgi:hypothetical protein
VLAACFALGGVAHQAQANPYAKYAGTTLVVNFPAHPYYDYALKLLPEFIKETGIKVRVVALGTGQALDLALINEHLVRLIAGEEVRIPFYDMKTGRRYNDRTPMKLGPYDLILIDSLHGLYPDMTKDVPDKQKFRIYLEPLLQMKTPEGRYVRWTDLRLMRRMLRANPQAAAMLGYADPAELVGKSILEFVDPADLERLRADLAALPGSGSGRGFNYGMRADAVPSQGLAWSNPC